jgi:hypothetical protein
MCEPDGTMPQRRRSSPLAKRTSLASRSRRSGLVLEISIAARVIAAVNGDGAVAKMKGARG